jgi:hypothetical protein
VRRAALIAAALALCALLSACGLGPGATPSNVTLTLSDGFGARVIAQSGAPKVVGDETVMQLLMRNATVATRYGGGFVQSIDGLAGDATAGRPVDWFYYVNGVEAPMGAAATTLNPGDRVWWDRHDWAATDDVPAVVGSYPAPFAGGIGGKHYPVTEFCATPNDDACNTVAAQLGTVGVPVAFGTLGTDEPDTLRVLVGPWTALRIDPAAVYLQQGPRASGVYARFPASGNALVLLNAQGQAVRTVTGSAGLVAADAIPNEVPTWLVTGTDSAGVDAASHAFNTATLRNHFAVALVGGAPVAVPVGGS